MIILHISKIHNTTRLPSYSTSSSSLPNYYTHTNENKTKPHTERNLHCRYRYNSSLLHTHFTHSTQHMATALAVRPNLSVAGSDLTRPPSFLRPGPDPIVKVLNSGGRLPGSVLFTRRVLSATPQAGSRADDSAPFEMSVESALRVLGVSEGASFDDILGARNSIIASCKDDQQAISQVLNFYFLFIQYLICDRNLQKLLFPISQSQKCLLGKGFSLFIFIICDLSKLC